MPNAIYMSCKLGMRGRVEPKGPVCHACHSGANTRSQNDVRASAVDARPMATRVVSAHRGGMLQLTLGAQLKMR